MPHALLRVLLVLLFLVLAPCARAATPLAGTNIDNQASVTYFDTDSGFHAKLLSNMVRVIVQPVEAVLIRPAQSFNRSPGSFAVLPYRVTNSGNVSATYALTYSNATGDQFDITGMTLYRDINGNGTVDVGEPVFAPGSTVTLAPGENTDFVLQGLIGATVALDQTAQVNFTATSQLQGATRTVTDTVLTALGASMRLQKTVSKLSAVGAEVLTYTLTAQNTGSGPATGVPITIDGSPTVRVVVRDVVPANTVLVQVGTSGPGTPLYHSAGDDTHTYTTAVPADLTLIDAIAVAYVKLDPGQTVMRSFDVKINSNASGKIVNQANVGFNDGLGASFAVVDSNPTITTVPKLPPTIAYYSDPGYTQPIMVARSEQTAYVQADAAQCNLDVGRAETYTVIITSAITGDIEEYVAKETGLNTGKFRIEPSISLTEQAGRSGDALITTGKNDSLLATMPACGDSLPAVVNLLIDPFGVVYDARSNVPVSGATVALFNVSTNSLAVVFAADGVTPSPNTVVTGTNGRYDFPTVAPGMYKLLVTPPGGYSFPSVVPPALLPADRVTHAQGSYGGEFPVNITTGPVHIDVPLDAGALGGLFIEKQSSRATVELGEFVDYTIKVKNSSGQLLGQIQVEDHLPAGFAYMPDSARLNGGTVLLNGSKLPEPEGGVGPKLIFNLGSVNDANVLTLTYRVRVGPGALQGDGTNRAQAFSARVTTGIATKISNIATVTVQVLPGVFSDRGYLIGKVYADCNRNLTQDKGEPGVPGVRLFLEDGTSVVTDGLGKYSLYGLRPQTHVVKLDRTTLPTGARLEVLSNRNANDAGSRFVDMKNSELHAADFALDACDDGLLKDIKRRAAAQTGSEEEWALRAPMSVDAETVPLADPKSLPASGIAGAAKLASVVPAAPVAQTAATTSRRSDALPNLDKVLPETDNQLALIFPADKSVLGTAQTPVVVKGTLGAKFVLKLNGEAVDEKRIGKRSELESKQSQAWEYIGLDLKPGVNRLEVDQYDGLGNVRGSAGITVTAPGNLTKLRLELPVRGAPADGKSQVQVRILATDAHDVPVTARTPVTLDTSSGVWMAKDLNPDEPGLQLFVEDGEGAVFLQAPREAGDIEITASAGDIKARTRLTFLPELRPMIAAGVIEGVLNLRKLDSRALTPARAQDGFDQELRHFSQTSRDGKTSAGARAAFFLKGKVKGDYLLTLAYDSDKEKKERLFRDIQPDEFYPVYGDSSVKGFDAQSTSKLYVRVDHGKSHAFYGDFNTQIQQVDEARKLGQYSRSLTGVKGHYEAGAVRVDTFASIDRTRQVVEEFAGRGTSGPYILKNAGFVENSEKVEIVVRDRNQPSIVLKTVPQTRFSEYVVERLDGRIIFKAPVPSLDENLNPVSIRVSYEVDQGGKNFLVAGVHGQVALTKNVEVGAGHVRDENPQDPNTLSSANVTIKLGEQTKLMAEVAQTDKASLGKGSGARVELKHESAKLQVHLLAGKTDVNFDNPAASFSKGRGEVGARAAYKVTDATTVKGEYLRSEDVTTGGVRQGGQIGVEQTFGNNVRGEVSIRTTQESTAPASAATVGVTPLDSTSVRAKLSGQVPGIPQASLYGEYEQDVEDSDKRMAAVGGDYRLANGGRVYARHELISSLGNRYSLNGTQQNNATVVGVDTAYMKDGHLFSEYRMRDALAARDAQAAVGLRHAWNLGEGWRLHLGLERVHSLSGVDTSESTAITSATEYTGSPLWKGSARLEYRNSRSSDTVFSTLGLAYKLDDEWTFLGKNAFELTNNDSAPDTLQNRLQLGLAWREADTNRWNGLMRIEQRFESADAQPGSYDLRRNVSIVSAHLNYQPTSALQLSGHYAGKWVSERSLGLASRYDTHLVSFKAAYDLTSKWDIGVNASSLFSGDLRSRQSGLGVETGYLVMNNLWLSVGYNFFDFVDKDLAGEDYTNPGAFVRLRFKFDENLR